MVQDSAILTAFEPEPDQGSRTRRKATVRELKEIAVFPHEIEHIGMLNTLTTAFFSAASASFAFVIGIVTNAAMQNGLSERAVGMLWIAIPGGSLLTLGFLGAGIWAFCTRVSATDQLLNQAVDLEPQPPPAPVIPGQ